jgi:GR25 family glycosyltransferase involved in LPS biosynthesis
VEGFAESQPQLQAFVINLDKDKSRYQSFQDSLAASDLSDVPMTRSVGTVGKEIVDIQTLLTPNAWNELRAIETHGHRTHHHQLSRGGVGCFLSHLKLMQQLADDPQQEEAYLIMEDDNHCFPNSLQLMTRAMQHAPSDWDILCGICHRADGNDISPDFKQVTGFWGLGGYLIRRDGALKLIQEVNDKKIDGQIDAYLSRMAQENKIRIYAANEPWFQHQGKDSNIQTPLVPLPGQDPFVFDGYRV